MSEVMEKPANVEASERYEQLVDELKAKYPQHRLSFGYIGNDSVRWGDDRCFRIFTRYRVYATGSSESFHLYGWKALTFDEQRERLIREWAASLDRKVAKGLLY